MSLNPLEVTLSQWEDQPDNRECCSKEWYEVRGEGDICTCNSCVSARSICLKSPSRKRVIEEIDNVHQNAEG
jgi:hypothetical protein